MNSANQPVVIGLVDKQPSALRFAIAEAQSSFSPLRVVHSAGFPTQVSEFYAGPDVLGDLRTAGQEVLDDARHFIEEQAPALDTEYILTTVPPAQALGEESASARVMVVGTDDVPWFDRLLRTKVSGHLARHATCPVVVVPEHDYPGGYDGNVILTLNGDTSVGGPIRFVFEDGNSATRPLLQLAFDIAQDRGGSVHALRAIPAGADPTAVDAAKVNLSEVLAGWAGQYSGVRVEQDVVVGDPDDACIAAAQSAELVLVGRSRRHGFHRPLAAGVVRHASCAVGVVALDGHDD